MTVVSDIHCIVWGAGTDTGQIAGAGWGSFINTKDGQYWPYWIVIQYWRAGIVLILLGCEKLGIKTL